MKHILVPTDFSEAAENALEVAAMIAKKHNAKITLLHLMEIPMQQIDPVSAHGDVPEVLFFMKLAERKFDYLKSKKYLESIEINETVAPNGNFNDIKSICKEHNIDYIVMGSHGATGLKEMFIGSSAEKVVRNSDVPVLVIKNKHEDFNVTNFVFASDFKNDDKQTYEQAVNLAKLLDSKIHLLMVNTANNFTTTEIANKRIADFISDVDFSNYTTNIYNDTTIENGILNFSKNISADLIGISTHSRQGIAHFFNNHLSEDIVNHAKRPVVTFKV